MHNSISWPPSYTVKKHPRARNVKLKVSIHKGLEFIIPPYFNQKKIPIILEEKRSWVEKQLNSIKLYTQNKDILPVDIDLVAINEKWQVDYVNSHSKLKIINRPHKKLALSGSISDKDECRKLLNAWVKEKAGFHLLTQLKLISNESKLIYNKATIRNQKTRWGSCSSDKSISLNYKLIFLPFELMRSVMIHELCHTIHLNHSDKFWQLMTSLDPQSRSHHAELRKYIQRLPLWLD